MKNTILLFFSFFCFAQVDSQNVKINAKAHPTYIGQTVDLVIEKNTITNTYEVLDSDTIDSLGYFQLQCETYSPRPAFIKINEVKASIYISPDYVYGIVFPKADSSDHLIERLEQTVNISILGSDSLELNALIVDFNIAFDRYWKTHYQEFIKRTHFKSLDSFELQIQSKYKDLRNPYFKAYIAYTFANINESTGRLKKYLGGKYLLNKPFEIQNSEYLKFLSSYFKNYYINRSFSKTQTTIYDVIASNKIEVLDAYVQSDPILKHDSLRHWVHCKNLFEMYYNGQFKKEDIRSLILQLKSMSNIDFIKDICYDILNVTNTEKVGTMASQFVLMDANNKLIDLYQFKTKYIYLQFFKSNNIQCLQELKKMQSIQKKYGNKVDFISVCLDDSISEFKDFKKANPGYNWVILYGGQDKKLFQDYDLKQSHQYFLLNKEHYIMRAPADMPSEGIETYFKRMFYKSKN